MIYRITALLTLLSGLALIILPLSGAASAMGPVVLTFFLSAAVAVRKSPLPAGFSYPLVIFAAVSASLYYPSVFLTIGSFDLRSLIVPLLMIIMFGMGTAMSFNDFAGVAKMPKGVLIGITCQLTIMPLVGFALANISGLPPEIAAGIILVGCSPSGLASNVMSFISKANLALSITLTAVATSLSPLTTPLLMKLLADQLVIIDFTEMFLSILKMVIFPIFAGLLFNKFAHGRLKMLDAAMPYVSMGGIAIIITIITAAGRDSLLSIGLTLIGLIIVHNAVGYLLGYWSCRWLGVDKKSCRTIAFEVGMQNSGLASGIALEMGRVATMGLAPAVFGPLMNITGSSLATWWRDKPVDEMNDEKVAPAKQAEVESS